MVLWVCHRIEKAVNVKKTNYSLVKVDDFFQHIKSTTTASEFAKPYSYKVLRTKRMK